jgi:hypothetical protein
MAQHLSICEDALADDLVRLETGGDGLSSCHVVLTPRGNQLLTIATPQARKNNTDYTD